MRIRQQSYSSAEEARSKTKKRKGRRISVLTLINVLFLFLGILCWTGTYLRNKALNEYRQCYSYEIDGDIICLRLHDGVKVNLRFGETSVSIKDAYRVSTTEDQTQVILFIRSYLQEDGKHLSRTVTDCLGEYRLHCKLYEQGYKREHTKDVDLEYEKDPRWYVGVSSRLLGWSGI